MRPVTETMNLPFSQMTPEERTALLKHLNAENTKIRVERQNKARKEFALKVQETGVVSIYGLGIRFPVSLRPEQYATLVARHEEIQKFFTDNAALIKSNQEAWDKLTPAEQKARKLAKSKGL